MSTRLFSRIIQFQLQASRLATTKPYSFKSAISLDSLYPQSSLSITKVPQPPQNEANKFSGFIPMGKLVITYSRGSGPGGMNVNKVSTKVHVKFKLDEADWIPETVRNNMKEKLKNLISKEGYIGIHSDRTRHQHLNMADALEKLREMIRACEPEEIVTPSPETLERLRRRREKAARERLLLKRSKSSIKGSRGSV